MAAKKRNTTKTAEKTSSKLIPLKKVCADLDMDPRAARRILRAKFADNHGSRERWEFTAAQAKKVKEVLGGTEA